MRPWRNPDIRLKDGTLSQGKKVLIDGQQRITALTAAVIGQAVLNKDYKETTIRIAYNPIAKDDESLFEVCNTAIERNPIWVNNIAPILNGELSISQARREYMKLNPHADEDQIEEKLEQLKAIKNRQIGIIELDSTLDIDTVTEIFIRINQKGVVLSNADFVMSKIASDEQFGGNRLRKMIDYFCHLLNDSSFNKIIKNNDKDFASTPDYKAISWIADINDELYQPNYIDVLRVAYTCQFSRGKFSDLVALLSGRDFENRRNVESIAEESYLKLRQGLEDFFSQTNYQRFVNLIQSAGFINKKLISSQTSLNFAYALYLQLRAKKLAEPKIQNLVKRWYVMSLLTGRYSGSSETAIEKDSKQILEKGVNAYLAQIEQSDLDDGFWNYRLVNELDSSSTVNNAYLCYLAAQCKASELSFLSDSFTVRSLIEQRGDVHHVFPKDYLAKKGFKKSEYNQVANYVYTEQAVNIKLGNAAPNIYMQTIQQDITSKKNDITSIKTKDDLNGNLELHCIPSDIDQLDANDYNDFLIARRKLMAQKIEVFYKSL
ncbi:DUF262 domain-containing protein [Acinetobacter sp. YIM 103518]|uniref:DUF262 domain-containing protein n=3 Tax=Acinetobacter faecalis TaxID=2665161 RepID=A0A6L6GHQ0_9GAMM|nr:DUF262 domain-containing protein [Acinetobacter faecalis]